MLQVFIHERSNDDENWNKERKNCIPHALILISQNECATVSGKLSEGENRMKNPIFYALVFNMEFTGQSGCVCRLCVDSSCILSLFLIFSVCTTTCRLFRYQIECDAWEEDSQKKTER